MLTDLNSPASVVVPTAERASEAVAGRTNLKSSPRLWVAALRVHQWTKNLLIFFPLILAQKFHTSDIYPVMLGFIFFSMVASATYLMNDLCDRNADRAHPTKCRRAIASGRISVPVATTVALALLITGTAGAAWLMRDFLVLVLCYIGITVAYSFWLKREPMFDVFTIGVLFVIRLVAGMIIIRNSISLWLSGFAFTFFMSLAMAKRHSELTEVARISGTAPKGRGYECDDRELTRAFGVGCALIAFLIMLLYFQFRAMETGLYDEVEVLYLAPVVVFAWTLRVWLMAHRGLLRDDPVIFALKDRVSWAYGAAIVIIWLIAIPT